jgi:hypothetical protein
MAGLYAIERERVAAKQARDIPLPKLFSSL